MKKSLAILLLLPLLAGCKQGDKAAAPVMTDVAQYVDPFVGTAGDGHTYPGATMPFGMVQMSPDMSVPKDPGWAGRKGWMCSSGYHDELTYIRGFSATHPSGTGASMFGDVALMPVVGDTQMDMNFSDDGYGSSYSHDTEKAAPGYYAVRLADYGIDVELTAGERVGCHRYTYPASDKAAIMLDNEQGIGNKPVESYIRVVDSLTIEGMRRSTGFVKDGQVFYYIKLSKPIASIVSKVDGKVGAERYIEGVSTKMRLCFATAEGEKVEARVALSTTDCAAARKNMEAEVPAFDFDGVRQRAYDRWNELLSRFQAVGDEHKLRTFYTALYHVLCMPNLITDADGTYRGWDREEYKSDTPLYTNFSLWDTYRAEHPLLQIAYPEINDNLVRSLLERYKQVGLLSTNEYGRCETWCMIGNHAVSVIVDAYLKDPKLPDAELAYEAVKHQMTEDHRKSDWTFYDRCGYFPADTSYMQPKPYYESVSRTLEACYNDYCVALLAQKLGHKDDADFFFKRAQYYRNLFDPAQGMMRGKKLDGNWMEESDVTEEAKHRRLAQLGYTEGNGLQYTWHVQNDPEGLISLFPSKDAMAQKLDSLFTTPMEDKDKLWDISGIIGQYAQGNEPSHHVPYLYNYLDRRDRTAELVREVCDKYYLDRRDGLCGNDDCGQMSAWYIFAALGFYPLNPASGEYVFGAPQFERVSVALPGGKTFAVVANGLSDTHKYVKSAKLNGKDHELRTITYDEIMKGGTLEYQMTDQPTYK